VGLEVGLEVGKAIVGMVARTTGGVVVRVAFPNLEPIWTGAHTASNAGPTALEEAASVEPAREPDY
jgi:hypothetical protein